MKESTKVLEEARQVLAKLIDKYGIAHADWQPLIDMYADKLLAAQAENQFQSIIKYQERERKLVALLQEYIDGRDVHKSYLIEKLEEIMGEKAEVTG